MKTREIIDYFREQNRSCLVTIENPATSLLKEETAVVQDLKKAMTSYCAYGFPYRKTTIFWHNYPSLELKTCSAQHCFWGKAHPQTVQHAPTAMRHIIPRSLCHEILCSACVALGGICRARIPLRVPGHLKAEIKAEKHQKKPGRPRVVIPGEMKCHDCQTTTPKYGKFFNLTKPPILCGRCYYKRKKEGVSSLRVSSGG